MTTDKKPSGHEAAILKPSSKTSKRRRPRLLLVTIVLCHVSPFALAADRLAATKSTVTNSTTIARPDATNPLNTGTRPDTAIIEPSNEPPQALRFDPLDGRVYITGDDGKNTASVKLDTLGNADPNDDRLVVSVNWGNQIFTSQVQRRLVQWIVFYGLGGDDTFTNYTDVPSNADGGAGNDNLSGGRSTDYLLGGIGRDYIYGNLGDDYLSGGADEDTLVGGEGSDILRGDDENDTIIDYAFSPQDQNMIDGGYGDDLIYGYGDASVVEISGGPGDDSIYAFGIATVYGDAGNDDIFGTSGHDFLYGHEGDDYIDAGDGNDLVIGGSGNDLIYGGGGHDTLFGQGGHDEIHGDAGKDFVNGGDDDDIVHGGSDDDHVYGGDGSDFVLGDSGNDFVSGGYATYDLNDGTVFDDDFSDWNTDDLWGGPGADEIVVADKKFWSYYLDEAIDGNSEDDIQYAGWTYFAVRAPGAFCGHLYQR